MANGILEINDILNEYSKDIQEEISLEAIRIAKKGANTLKQTSPKSKRKTSHKGKYAKGWRTKVEKGRGYINCTIYNATDWQLTHLLEKEHATYHGGKYVPKQKHIEPVHDSCVEEFNESVEKLIEQGG